MNDDFFSTDRIAKAVSHIFNDVAEDQRMAWLKKFCWHLFQEIPKAAFRALDADIDDMKKASPPGIQWPRLRHDAHMTAYTLGTLVALVDEGKHGLQVVQDFGDLLLDICDGSEFDAAAHDRILQSRLTRSIQN